MKISDIKIGERHRKDMGDLAALAESIKTEGLLQPVGVTEDNELVFGLRRLTACRDILGWYAIEHRVVNVTSIVNGEYAENEMRKAFTMTERVAILKTIETVGEGKRTDLISQDIRLSRTEAARRAGFESPMTAWRAEKIVEDAPDLAEKVDRGEIKITTAFTQADREGRIKRERAPRSTKKDAKPKRINPPMISLGTLPTGVDIGQPAEGFANVGERLAWREKVGAKVVLHPLRIKQLMEDKEVVEQIGTALAILERSPEFVQFQESLERMLKYRRPENSKEPGDKINFVKSARGARASVVERLEGAISKLEGYRVLLGRDNEPQADRGRDREQAP